MTLQHLIDTHAGDWKRQDYAASTPLGDLGKELNAHLREYAKADLGFEGLSSVFDWTLAAPAWYPADYPRLTATTKLEDVGYRWIAVYPVTGSNEGHYIHVDLIQQGVGPHKQDERRIPLFMSKTFAGQEAAVQIAAELCRVLGV